MRVMAFNDNVERLSQVKQDDKLYAEGKLQCKVYEPEGKPPRLDLTLLATFIRRTQIGSSPRQEKPKAEPGPRNFVNALTAPGFLAKPDILAHQRQKPRIQGLNDDLNDAMPF